MDKASDESVTELSSFGSLGGPSMRCRRLGLVCLVLLVAAGCADLQLRRSTARQASTLTSLQYQQVLNNLAMLHADPTALPALIALKSGTAQVADTGSLGVGLDLGSRTHTTPNLLGTRSVVEQWNTSPVSDDTTLRLLRLAYHRTMGDPPVLTADDANDLAHTLSAQIGTNADISTDADTLRALVAISREGTPAPSTASADPSVQPAILTTARLPEAGEALAQPPGRVPALPPPLPNQPNVGNVTGTGPGTIPQPNRTPAPNQFIVSPGITLSAGTPATVQKVLTDYHFLDENLTSTLDEQILVDDPDTPFKFKSNKSLATGLAKETIRQVNDVQDMLLKLGPGWYRVGRKHDVPKHACFVGSYGDVYVWVEPPGRAGLAEFTLAVLSLSSLVKDTQVVTMPSGLQFSPALSSPR
jgi:hypothetical protein